MICPTPQPNFPSHRLSHRGRFCGFSLLEVVFAIGIVSFAIVPIMGLMPTGLQLFRSSSEDAALALIRTELVSEFRALGFAKIQGSAFERKYDVNGEKVESGSALAIYEVVLQAIDSGPMTATGVQETLARLTFEVKKNQRTNGTMTVSVADDGT